MAWDGVEPKYTTNGFRVAQSLNGNVTNFAWDWASGIPEMLSIGDNLYQDNLYLIGHDTLGQSTNGAWDYYLPDALGSIRQTTDDVGAVSGSREWTPFGVEVGTARGGLGYTGEWFDPYTKFNYLRARWPARNSILGWRCHQLCVSSFAPGTCESNHTHLCYTTPHPVEFIAVIRVALRQTEQLESAVRK